MTLVRRIVAPFLRAASNAFGMLAAACWPDEAEEEGVPIYEFGTNGHHEAEITRREQR